MNNTKTFSAKELEEFVHDHIQQKIDHNELHLTGIDFNPSNEVIEREFEIYQNALLEGIMNGILMCDCKIEGVVTE